MGLFFSSLFKFLSFPNVVVPTTQRPVAPTGLFLGATLGERRHSPRSPSSAATSPSRHGPPPSRPRGRTRACARTARRRRWDPPHFFFQIRGSQKPLRAFVTNFRSSLDFRRHFRVKDPEPRHRQKRGGGRAGAAVARFAALCSEHSSRQVKELLPGSGCHTFPRCPPVLPAAEAWNPSGRVRRRRLGELRCLSPLPLDRRAAAPAPLPGGGYEPVGVGASPPGLPVTSSEGDRSPAQPLPGTWHGFDCWAGLRPEPGRAGPPLARRVTYPGQTLSESPLTDSVWRGTPVFPLGR